MSTGSAEAAPVEVPDIGDFTDVPIIEILVSPGDAVEAEDPLVTLESDKATMDVPAPFAGTVKQLQVKVGDRVSEGSQLLTLERADGAPSSEPSELGKVAPAAVEDESAAEAEPAPEPESAQESESESERRVAGVGVGVGVGRVAGVGAGVRGGRRRSGLREPLDQAARARTGREPPVRPWEWPQGQDHARGRRGRRRRRRRGGGSVRARGGARARAAAVAVCRF